MATKVGAAASITLFFVLLALTIYGVAAGGFLPGGGEGVAPEPQERVVQPSGAEGQAASGSDDEVIVALKLNEARVDCVDGSPHLSLQTDARSLPRGTVVKVQPLRLVRDDENGREYAPVREAHKIEVEDQASTIEATLPQSIAAEEADVLSILAVAEENDGTKLQSNVLRVAADSARC